MSFNDDDELDIKSISDDNDEELDDLEVEVDDPLLEDDDFGMKEDMDEEDGAPEGFVADINGDEY